MFVGIAARFITVLVSTLPEVGASSWIEAVSG